MRMYVRAFGGWGHLSSVACNRHGCRVSVLVGLGRHPRDGPNHLHFIITTALGTRGSVNMASPAPIDIPTTHRSNAP